VATKPNDHTADGDRDGLWNQPFCPRYQMAVQSPRRSAMANVCPVSTRDEWSEMCMVPGDPSGRSAMSLSSGASARGSVCRMTDPDPRAGHG
jgi:hypothetical protein